MSVSLCACVCMVRGVRAQGHSFLWQYIDKPRARETIKFDESTAYVEVRTSIELAVKSYTKQEKEGKDRPFFLCVLVSVICLQ
jgi:hypothetical protein